MTNHRLRGRVPRGPSTAGPARLLRIAGQGAWAIADQAVSSISNLLLAVLVARASTPREFGAYSLAFAGYSLWVGLSRWIGGTIFMIQYASVPRTRQRDHYRELTGVGLSASLIGSLIFILAAAIFGGPITGFFIVMSVLLPGLVVQDDWRQAMFAARDSRGAFLCDLLWLVVEVPLLLAAHWTAPHDPVGYVAAWGVGALTAACVFAVIERSAPSITGAYRFVKANIGLVPGLASDYLAITGGAQLLPYGIAAVIGLSAAGGLRAAQVIFGLVASPLMGLIPLAMVYCVRAYEAGGRRRLHMLQLVLIAPGCVMVGVFTVAVQFMPGWLGRDLTGSSWTDGRRLLLALGLVYVAQWISSVNLIALRAAGRVRQVAAINTVLTLVVLAAALGLGAAYGISAATWGMVVSATFGAAMSAIASRSIPARAPAVRDRVT